MAREYRTVTQITGPLLFVEKTEFVGYGELVEIVLASGERRRGQVLDSSKDVVVVQVFEGTTGIDRLASVKFLGETIKLGVSKDMLGRILDGAGDPIDGGPAIIPDERRDIIGAAINPYARDNSARRIFLMNRARMWLDPNPRSDCRKSPESSARSFSRRLPVSQYPRREPTASAAIPSKLRATGTWMWGLGNASI